METIQIRRVEESLIGEEERTAIASLLQVCFPGYPGGRIYYKQLPSFRYLAWSGKQLAGQLAVEHRMISIGGTPARIFGISDLCVAPAFRRMKVGSDLLRAAEQEGIRSGAGFLLLISEPLPVYLNAGFSAANNLCCWLSIGDHESIGIVRGRLQGSLLVKPLGDKKWGEGTVDFLGYMI